MDDLLRNLDVGPMGALWRLLFGAAFALALSTWVPGASLACAATSLAVALFVMKAFAAVARKVVPATARTRDEWALRRAVAANRDSYQWRKLLWVGLGILAVVVVTGWRPGSLAALGGACVAAGAVAEIAWRSLGLTPNGRVRA